MISRRRFAAICTAGVLLLLCFAFVIKYNFSYLPAAKLAGVTARITGFVAEEPQKTGNTYGFILKTESIDAEFECPQRLKIMVYSLSAPEACSTVSLTSVLKLTEDTPSLKMNSFKAQSVFLTALCSDSPKQLEKNGHAVEKSLHAVRSFITIKLAQVYSDSDLALVRALVLGDRSMINEEDYEMVRNAGGAHLLAVSGLHVSILVTAFVGFLYKILRFGIRPSAIAGAVFVIFYMALLGFAPAVTRAGIMICIMLAGRVIFRRPGLLGSLCFSGALMLLVNPFLIGSAGFLMSFFATFGIILCGYKLEPRITGFTNRFPRPLNSFCRIVLCALAVGITASVFVMPLCLMFFGTVPTLSVITSMLLTPVITLLIPLSVLSLFFTWSGIMTALLSHPATLLCRLFYLTTERLGRLPFAVIPAGNGFLAAGLCIGGFALLILLFTDVFFKKKLLCILSCAIIIASGFGAQAVYNRESVFVAIISSGKTPAVIIENKEHSTVIGTGGSKYGVSSINYHLKSFGIKAVDILGLPAGAGYGSFYEHAVKLLNPAELAVPATNKILFDGDFCDKIEQKISDSTHITVEMGEKGFIISMCTGEQSAIIIGGGAFAETTGYDTVFFLDEESALMCGGDYNILPDLIRIRVSEIGIDTEKMLMN